MEDNRVGECVQTYVMYRVKDKVQSHVPYYADYASRIRVYECMRSVYNNVCASLKANIMRSIYSLGEKK